MTGGLAVTEDSTAHRDQTRNLTDRERKLQSQTGLKSCAFFGAQFVKKKKSIIPESNPIHHKKYKEKVSSEVI